MIFLSSYFIIPQPASYFLSSYLLNVVEPVLFSLKYQKSFRQNHGVCRQYQDHTWIALLFNSKWGIPWAGYLVPARDGSGLLPDWESSWDVAAAAAAVVAAAVTWKFRLTFWLGNYIWSFQIGFWLIWELSEFWDQGSTQNSAPDLSSRVIWPGEPFWKKLWFRMYFQT